MDPQTAEFKQKLALPMQGELCFLEDLRKVTAQD